MSQYRITSAAFHIPGSNPNIPDTYIDPAVLNQVRAEAGIDPLGIAALSVTAEVNPKQYPNKGKYQQDNNIKPGTEEWFKLWFGDAR